jgi:hypothetical protein
VSGRLEKGAPGFGERRTAERKQTAQERPVISALRPYIDAILSTKTASHSMRRAPTKVDAATVILSRASMPAPTPSGEPKRTPEWLRAGPTRYEATEKNSCDWQRKREAIGVNCVALRDLAADRLQLADAL